MHRLVHGCMFPICTRKMRIRFLRPETYGTSTSGCDSQVFISARSVSNLSCFFASNSLWTRSRLVIGWRFTAAATAVNTVWSHASYPARLIMPDDSLHPRTRFRSVIRRPFIEDGTHSLTVESKPESVFLRKLGNLPFSLLLV